LAGVSLELEAGEVGVVVGPRDAGKTMLLRVAGGMKVADRGTVLLGGRDLAAMSNSDRERLLAGDIAWASRSGPGRMRFRTLEYVGLPLRGGYRLPSREPDRLARAALKRVGAQGCAGLEWSQLSTWQQVCVELAQAIVREPLLLLADELVDGLSMRSTREAMRLIRSLAAEQGCGVLVTAGDLEPGMLADRTWTIEDGELDVLVSDEGEDPPIIEPQTVIDLPQRRRRIS
jgi:putative ABC transport system ATP-binding protein